MIKKAVLIAGLAMVCGTARAETVGLSSKISEINNSGNYLKVYYLNPQTNNNEEIRVDVDPSTRFRGVDSLRDLKTDDEISIDADFNNFTHEWKAQMISLIKAVETPPIPENTVVST